MPFRFHSSRSQLFGAVCVAAALVFGSAAAESPRPGKGAAAPSSPGASTGDAGGAPQGAAPTGPLKLELRPNQPEWTKVCGKDQAANKEVCYTTRDFSTDSEKTPVLALAVYDVKGDDVKMVRLLLPPGLMLKPGIRMTADGFSAPLQGGFEICFPNGCFAEVKMKKAEIDAMKKVQSISVAVKNQAGGELTFVVPMEGFAKGFEGPAIDPKVLEEQQKQLEDQLKKRADEERRKLEGDKGGAAPAPNAATPSAPAPSAAPAAK